MNKVFVIFWNDYPMAITRNAAEVESLKARIRDFATKTDKNAIIWLHEVPDFTGETRQYTESDAYGF